MNFNNHGLIVPDVSFYQDDDQTPQKIDFSKMKSAGAVGVILRGGQNTWIDEDFADYRRDAKAAGLPRGYYWFYDSRIDPGKQANIWRAAIGDDLPELCLWADLEENYNGPYKTESHYKSFVLATQAFFPSVEVGIYTADWWWYDKAKRGIIKDDAFWAKLRLWVAQYLVNQAEVILPRPWNGQEPVFWQFTASGDGARFGVESKEIDLNYFNGDLARYQQLFGLDPIPDDGEEEGNEMAIYKGTVLATATLQIRSGPGTNYQDVGDLHYQDKVEASEIIGGWWKLTAKNGQPVTGYSFSNNGSFIRTDQVLPDPQPDFPPRIGYTLDGVTIKWYVPE